ncbi:hypothetical protein BK133_09295 [Paenibacillus sp. FSL H8-0548]|uniref:hypothetical protein n=1 Tax=Paenibacillus sp. FSL H8-0548 TaxID=1920422 RepID=UPI00096F832E|nr:hypothetical protein [Paenibacillus sp. FSL H8-0548]OMF36824.1 hypothetical protein BK133_09295 [Paenibacillus sp. FSL H8-0548]
MNISQMMRSFLGEASGTDSRAMELKAGQVVRGVVLQVTENNEALVQINGVQVRAKMDPPLQVGQSAILQVQPQTSGALVVLKAVEPGQVGLPEDTFKEWAKQLALPEQKWAIEVVKDLRKEGIILNREISSAFQQAAAAMPAGGDIEEWMTAAASTFKRGLPMTGATIGAMQQVMFGRSSHELLETLQRQLTSLVNTGGTEGAAPESAKPLPQAAARVLALLANGMELQRIAASEPENTINAAQAGAKEAAAAASAKLQTLQPAQLAKGEPILSNVVSPPVEEGHAETALPQSARAAVGQTNWLGQMMKWMGVDHELQLAKAFAGDGQPAAQSTVSQAMTAEESVKPVPAAAAQNQANTQASPIVSETSGKEAAPLNMQAAGKLEVADEQQQLQQIKNNDPRQGIERAVAALISSTEEGLQAHSTGAPTQQESLKSALLSLISSDQVPAAIKETAQQLVQQITGQQLLLTPERNSSVLTHVTMFIPLSSPDGQQTASVHIQTRRGRKGELDASNCRLLFNLSMNTLGDTMVDVNVTDKIVSLNLWNDHPAIAMLTESSRSEIAESLQQAGFQLLSLRTTPLPKAGEQVSNEETKKSPQLPEMSAFTSNRYKGVDYRI